MLNVPEVSLKTFCPDDPPFYHKCYSLSIRSFEIERQKVKYVCNIFLSKQGGEGRVSEAENLRSSRAIQSIFNLLGRTGKNIIFIL